MRRVHKEGTRHFLVGELRQASVSHLVDDQTGETIGTLAAAMSSMYDSSSRNFFTCDGGVTFYAVSYDPRLNGIAMLVSDDFGTNTAMVASLRLPLGEWTVTADAKRLRPE